MPGLCYFATICNSTVIELCKDIIRICQRFVTCQQCMYIADILYDEV
jgi:hypothetical protein